MAKIVFTFEDATSDGKTGVSCKIESDLQGSNPDAAATPALKIAATIRRMWDTGVLPAMVPLACPEIVQTPKQQKIVRRRDAVEAEVVS